MYINLLCLFVCLFVFVLFLVPFFVLFCFVSFFFKGHVNPATISKPEFCIFLNHFKHEYVSFHYQHK